MTKIFPHPKRGYEGFDPGRPDHVATLAVTKVGRKYVVYTPYGFIAFRAGTKFQATDYIARATERAAEEQEFRARAYAERKAKIEEYLTKRAARAAQLPLF